MRQIWRLPPMTHCNLVALISDCTPLEFNLMKRFCKFYNGINVNGTDVLKTILGIARNNPVSNVCLNVVDICSKFCTYDMKSCQSVITKSWYDNVTDTQKCDVLALREMIDIRDGLKQCDILSKEEVECFIYEICVN